MAPSSTTTTTVLAKQPPKRFLGQNPAVLWAVWENVVSWMVRSYLPSWLPRLVPACPHEEVKENENGRTLAKKEKEEATAAGDTIQNDDSSDRTRCILIGRPGGMEQLRLVTVKRTSPVVTCGYNLQSSAGPFVDPTSSQDDLPDPDCVILHNHAFSVNFADCCIRWGLYESAKQYVGYPICPGFDVAGVVEQVGSQVTNLQVGDRVFGCSLFGAYSTHVMVPAVQLRKIPSMEKNQQSPSPQPLSMTQAASIPAVALTALYALFLAGHYPTPNKYNNKAILIHSAAGGVGSMLVQMSKLLGLNPIVGVVGRSSKVEAAKVLGCHVVIDKSQYKNDDELWQAIHEASPQGYGTIMESNGVSTLTKSYQHLALTGRLIVYGFHTNLPIGRDMLSPWEWFRMAGQMSKMPKFDAMEMGSENKGVLAFNLSFFAQEREMLSDLFDQVCTWLSQEKLVCARVTTFPMEQIAEAHELIQSGTSIGKIVMTTTTTATSENISS